MSAPATALSEFRAPVLHYESVQTLPPEDPIMDAYHLWLFACTSLGVALISVAALELGITLAKTGLDRPPKENLRTRRRTRCQRRASAGR